MDTIKGTRRWWKYWWALLLIVLVVVAAYSYRPKVSAAARTPSSAGTAKKGTKGKGGGDGAASTPVIAVKARKGNIGVYFTGLGAVTPIYTVTLKSRVDGELMSVLYREGDIARK